MCTYIHVYTPDESQMLACTESHHGQYDGIEQLRCWRGLWNRKYNQQSRSVVNNPLFNV